MASGEVARKNEGQRIAAAERQKTRRDAGDFAGAEAIAPIENCVVDCHDGLEQPVLADIVGKGRQFVALHERK